MSTTADPDARTAGPEGAYAVGRGRSSRSARALALLRAHPLVVVFGVLGLVTRLAYWQVTERKFEDGLITVAHAVSVAEGIGLTHHPYEPVTHGFTTALSVLVPTVGELINGVWSYVDGFLVLRTVSLVAFVVAIVFADRIARRLGVGTWGRVFVLGFMAVDYNHIMYGMSGMETQIGVAVLLAAVDATMRRATVAAGVLFGLCVLARPDFALFIGPALLMLLLWRRREALRAGVISLAVVAPWLIFTTAYFGSPVPNTIQAKSLRYTVPWPESLSPVAWWEFTTSQVGGRLDHTWHQFTPFLNNGFVVDAPLHPFLSAGIATVFLGLAVIGGYLARRDFGWAAVLGFLALFATYRLLTLPEGYYEWYYPPVTALVALCAGLGITYVHRLARKTGIVLSVGLFAVFALPLPSMIVLDSRIQHDIEDRVRVPMGKWLNVNVPPGESVTSESAGYVGYFGRVKLYDYPGLTSKETLAIMKRLGPERNSLFELVRAAGSDFVVLRPSERQAFQEQFGDVADDYKEVASFGVPFEQTKLEWGGVAMVNIDREFVVMRRR